MSVTTLVEQNQRVLEKGRKFSEESIAAAFSRARLDIRTFKESPFRGLYAMVIGRGPAAIEPHAAEAAQFIGPAMRARPERKSTADLGVGNIANLLACSGYPDETALLADWLYEIETKRNGTPGSHFERAFAALALDVKPIYRSLGGQEPTDPLPFRAGASFGGNIHGVLRHLGGAVEHGASFADVRDVWDEVLVNWPLHEEAGGLDLACLFWIARVVRHRIAGEALGGVAQWLHEYILDMAARGE